LKSESSIILDFVMKKQKKKKREREIEKKKKNENEERERGKMSCGDLKYVCLSFIFF